MPPVRRPPPPVSDLSLRSAGIGSNLEEVKAKVLIRPKEGILDPQGKAVERALPTLGVDSVSDVRIGRMVELHYEDRAELEGLCEKLLVNPLIEDYEIEEMG
jgi:phosphoribosylformylglycinamidine synthase PurS subunit